MKKLCFMMLLMLAMAVPAMASGGTYAGTGVIADDCQIWAAPFGLNLGAHDFVGSVTTTIATFTNSNKDATISCAIEAGGVDDRVLGKNTGHSMLASVSWDENGLQDLGVPKPQIVSQHDCTISVVRSGYADLADEYSTTLHLNIVCDP